MFKGIEVKNLLEGTPYYEDKLLAPMGGFRILRSRFRPFGLADNILFLLILYSVVNSSIPGHTWK